jgi:chemotaxis protein histidine kinase CheA
VPADAVREDLAELLARARIAVLALAPEESPEGQSDAPAPDAWEDASAAIARLLPALEDGDDTLRALLAVDMALGVEHAASETAGHGRGKLVSLLSQALSVLAGDPPVDDSDGSLPSRSPLALANELRALRGAPSLSGNRVFAIAVDAGRAVDDSDAPAAVDPRLAPSARRLRSYYQQGLVAWLRDPRHTKTAADRIGEVFARLHVLTRGTGQEPLWRAAASFARLLEDPRWRVSTAIKRLLGQLDGQLKRLCGPDGPAPEPAPALVRDLLFYVGESRDVEATIGVFPSRSALLAAFAAPQGTHSEQPTAVLSLLNELLAISGQIMEALAPDESWLVKRSWLIERMLQVADGLGLLGAHRLRHRMLEETGLLRATSRSGDPPVGGWGQVAERLHVIGADLLTAAGMEPAAAVAEDTAGMPSRGRIARRLEADLVHAERLIQRLERGHPGAPAEGAVDTEDDAEGASMLRNRIDALAGATADDGEGAQAQGAVGASAEAPGEAPPVAAVDHGLLDDVAHIAGEIDAARSRLEQQVGAFREGLQDMDTGIRALREELDGLRLHTESLRMPHDPADSGEMPAHPGRAGAVADIRDRLERLSSGIGAIAELRDAIESIAGDSRSALVQQARDNVALEQRLMQFRMQPLDVLLEDLGGEIAERAADAGKQVVLRLDAGELRIEPEKMAALLPVLRSLTASMIDSGVEPPRARVLAGRPPGCLMELRSRRRGADLEMVLSADCRAPSEGTVAEARDFLRPLGGCLVLEPTGRFETRMSLQMPLAPRVTTVLLVAVASEILALPLAEVSAVLQLPAEALEAGEEAGIEHDGLRWRLGRLGDLLALDEGSPPVPSGRLPLVLVESGSLRRALVVDAIGERVDVVVRSIAPQLRSLSGLAGAAILGDGQVVLLLDVGELMETRSRGTPADLETVV